MSDAEVKSLSRKMDRILFILDNDEDTESKGLVAQFADLKKQFHSFVSQYNIDQAVKKGKDTVWKIVWGSAGAALLLILKAAIAFVLKLF